MFTYTLQNSLTLLKLSPQKHTKQCCFMWMSTSHALVKLRTDVQNVRVHDTIAALSARDRNRRKETGNKSAIYNTIYTTLSYVCPRKKFVFWFTVHIKAELLPSKRLYAVCVTSCFHEYWGRHQTIVIKPTDNVPCCALANVQRQQRALGHLLWNMNRLSAIADEESSTDSHLLWMGKHEQTPKLSGTS